MTEYSMYSAVNIYSYGEECNFYITSINCERVIVFKQVSQTLPRPTIGQANW